MSTSPLLTPGHRQRRRALQRRRRRNRRAATGALLLALAAGIVVAVGLSGSHGHTRTTASAETRAAAVAPPPAAASSAIGLPLGTPPLTLKGLSAPQRDPLRVPFRHPPRAGLLFDLETGQVLWQRNPLRRVRIASLTKMMTALIAVKEAPPDARVLVTREAVNTAGSKVGVLPLGRHVRLVMAEEIRPRPPDIDPVRETIAPPRVVFRNRMELRQVERDQLDVVHLAERSELEGSVGRR